MKKETKLIIISIVCMFALQYSHAQWEDAGWRRDGYINAITVCNGTMIRADDDFMMTSSDVGNTWQKVSEFKGKIKDFSKNDNSILVVASSHPGGVFLSSDCGFSWELISSGVISDKGISSIVMSGDTIVAGSFYGARIYISTDLGETWELKSSGLPNAGEFSINSIAFENEIIFVSISHKYGPAANTGLYKSSDFGDTWEYQGTETADATEVYFYGDRVYVYSNGLKLSENMGETWTAANLDEYIRTINSNADKLYTGTANGVFCSLYGGDKWIDYGLKGVSVNSISFLDDNIIASSSRSLYILKSPNGDWQQLDTLFDMGKVTKLAIKNGLLYAITGDTKIMVSNDIGETWKIVNPMTKINNAWSFEAINDKLYLGSFNETNGGLYSSVDNGKSWQLNKQLAQLSPTGSLRILSVSSLDSYIFSGTTHGLFHSTDNGLNWSIHTENIGLLTDGFASIDSELFIKGNPILLQSTTDYGETWIEKECNGLLPVNAGIRTLFAYENILFFSYRGAGEQSGLYISKDRGDNWDRITGYTDVVRSYAFDKYIFACTTSGVIVTVDEGENWVELYEGARATIINDIKRMGDYLIVAADQGFSRAKISDIADLIITAVPEELPIAAQENTVYPNPTDAYLYIDKFEGSPMDYEIFDYAGKKVLSGTLNGYKIDVSALPAAAYIVVLSDETQKHTMKFIKK